MAEYTPQIDAFIAGKLALQGWVDAAGVPGLSDDEALRFFERYMAEHADDALHIDGSVLRLGAPSAPIGPEAPAAQVPAPVGPPPQPYAPAPANPPGAYMPSGAYMAPGRDDPGYIAEPPASSRISGWLWLLPIMFGLIGGVVGWVMNKDKDPTGARNLLLVGVAVTVVSACLPFALGLGALGVSEDPLSVPTGAVWPPTGALTFYYFGSPG